MYGFGPIDDTGVTLVKGKPTNYKAIKKCFPEVDDKNVVITVGNKIYSETPLRNDIIVHELVHVEQQSLIGPAVWWEQFLASPAFRYRQELECYRAQYKYIKSIIKDRNQVNVFHRQFALFLSGPMYDNMVTYTRALRDIRSMTGNAIEDVRK